jgi:hypothetical protein
MSVIYRKIASRKVSLPSALVLGFFVLNAPIVVIPKASAQPATSSTITQSNIDKMMGQIKMEEIAKTRLTLNADNASLAEIVEKIKELLPNLKPLEVRASNPVKVTFALKNTPTDSILQSAATLAGCDLFIFHDKIVIAPPAQLSQAERTEWLGSHSTSGPVSYRGMESVLAQDVIAEVQRDNKEGVAFSSLSTESQRSLLRMISRFRQSTGPTPTPDAIVTVISEPGNFGLAISTPYPGPSQKDKHQYRFTFMTK